MEKLTLFSTNMDNLTEQEQKQLITLVNKGKKPLKKRWKAGVNGRYFFVSGIGEIARLVEEDGSFDKKAYALGNYFATEEEAEFELNKRLVLQELKDYALEHNEEDIDWSDSKKRKWFITYNHSKFGGVLTDFCSNCQDLGQIYFNSRKIACDAIQSVGEGRIKKYLFGVN